MKNVTITPLKITPTRICWHETPLRGSTPWAGQSEFLLGLEKYEDKAKKSPRKETRGCSLCGLAVARADFHRDGYAWRASLHHYVQDHNYKPTEAFIKEVCILNDPMVKTLGVKTLGVKTLRVKTLKVKAKPALSPGDLVELKTKGFSGDTIFIKSIFKGSHPLCYLGVSSQQREVRFTGSEVKRIVQRLEQSIEKMFASLQPEPAISNGTLHILIDGETAPKEVPIQELPIGKLFYILPPMPASIAPLNEVHELLLDYLGRLEDHECDRATSMDDEKKIKKRYGKERDEIEQLCARVTLSPAVKTAVKVPEDKVPEDKVPEDKVPEDKVPEDKVPEDKKLAAKKSLPALKKKKAKWGKPHADIHPHVGASMDMMNCLEAQFHFRGSKWPTLFGTLQERPLVGDVIVALNEEWIVTHVVHKVSLVHHAQPAPITVLLELRPGHRLFDDDGVDNDTHSPDESDPESVAEEE